jgi:hypothetical protein|tara:strand:+ start:171 stop:872 length:702 start_codon:yes stop_codon:yes gene_type:complete
MSAPNLFADDSILSDDPVDADGNPLEILHDREYRVRAFRLAPDRVLIRGAVRDQKPPGLYLPEDPEPLTIHHMQVDIEVSYPSMEIVAAKVHMETHPNLECTRIEPHYGKLVGLSIARGFTHKVKELFGGPRACTHTTALLQAMAPVAIQCVWSMRASDASKPGGYDSGVPMERSDMWKMNLNTCHVWAEDSDVVAKYAAGGTSEPPEPPEFARERMVKLGISPSDWAQRMGL